MISLFDCNFISILFHDKAHVPRDSKGALLVPNAKERIELLVSELSKQRTKIILPAPALAEFMLLASDSWAEYLAIIRRKAVFEIAGFDDPEAVELVHLCLSEGKIKARRPNVETWAKMKYDRQIVAIAKSNRVEVVYSTDEDIHKLAKKVGIQSRDLVHLPAPGPKQMTLHDDQPEPSNVIAFPQAADIGQP